jgi:hypothetical protein
VRAHGAPNRKTLVRGYRHLVELAEHDLETLPDPDGAGRSARLGVALRVLQIVDQARKLRIVSGLERATPTQERLKQYEVRLDALEKRAREVVGEGPGGLVSGNRADRRRPPGRAASGSMSREYEPWG